MDKIIINELRTQCVIGIHPHERIEPQEICVTVTCFVTERNPETEDNISNCLNYQNLAEEINDLIQCSMRFTIEALADDIAKLCLNEERILKIVVRVEKPNAIAKARFAGVEITRSRCK